MTDRELLELAAKAAGYVELQFDSKIDGLTDYEGWIWNPLTDDGDALWLAVKLKLLGGNYFDSCQFETGDPYAATRRAIVRAAAEIGKGMK